VGCSLSTPSPAAPFAPMGRYSITAYTVATYAPSSISRRQASGQRR
jgi:hypothetical protein